MSRHPKDGSLQRINVSALARELGTSPGNVSSKLRLGMTPEQIADQVRKRNQTIAAGGVVRGRVEGTEAEAWRPSGVSVVKTPGTYAGKEKATDGRAKLGTTRETVGVYGVRHPVGTRVVMADSHPYGGRSGVIARYEVVAIFADEGPKPVIRLDGDGAEAFAMEAGDFTLIRASVVPSVNVKFSDADADEYEATGENIAQAQLRKEVGLANLRELEYLQKKGMLVPVTMVNAWFGDVIIRARDGLLRLPAELRDRIAAETDPVEVEKMMREKIEEVLRRLRTMDGRDTGTDLARISGMATDGEAA